MEMYISMTSMMMQNITIEVSVNIDLPLKGRPQAWLGHLLLGMYSLDLFDFWEL